MREIKFRAWDKEKKEWVYFGLNEVYGMGQDLPNGYAKIDFDKLMQYTGLKDKNGKEIYEGDIVTDAVGDKREIIFEDGWFCCKYPDGSRYCPTESNRAVIGNIYENQELLSSN